jgi:anthranilate phosphoribosyltransferase
VSTFHVHPADFGISKTTPATLKGGDAATNAAIVRRVLQGERGPARDVVLLNAGAALFIAARAASVREGIERAAAAVDAGEAARTLDAMVRASHLRDGSAVGA